MNTALYALYDDPRLAEQASQQLMSAGIARDAIKLITSAQMAVGHVGSFGDSGAHEHDATRDQMGSFGDAGAHVHNVARDRVGSFAGVEPWQVGDDLAGELARAGLMGDQASVALERISAGATLLLVRVTADQAHRAAAILGVA
jgi:hypothetical protein